MNEEALTRLEQALEDEAELPTPVRKRVRVYNTDETDVSPEELVKRSEKKGGRIWLLLAVALAVAVALAKWKGLF